MDFDGSPFLLINFVSLYLSRQLFAQLFNQKRDTYRPTLFYMGQWIVNHRCIWHSRVNQINRHLLITHKVHQ